MAGHASAALALAAAAALVLAALPPAAAHGFMATPASRNVIHSTYYPRTAAERSQYPESYWNYCPHCLAAGGPGLVSNDSQLDWPTGLHGFCGDVYYKDGLAPNVDTNRDHDAGGRFATGEIGGTYDEGGVMNISIGITAHHNGRFGFRICRVLAPAPGQTWEQAEREQLSEECFNQHVLVQADVEGSQAPFQAHSYLPYRQWQGYNFNLSAPTFTYHYTVPDGLHCDGVQARCVLQWHWVTGNSCTPPGTPPEFAASNLIECGNSTDVAYPEEFWNCADIRTVPRANAPPSPPRPPPKPPSPKPPPSPPPSPPKPIPAPSPPGVSGYPCDSGNAACFCQWKGTLGKYADVKSGCQSFYECVGPVQSFYASCPAGLVYSEAIRECDWPANVACEVPADVSSPSPPPSPPSGAGSSPPPAPRPPSPRPPPLQPPAPRAPSPNPPPPRPKPPSPRPPPPRPSPKPPSPKPPPSPPPSPPKPIPAPSPPGVSGGGYPCDSGNAACFCQWKGTLGDYADVKSGCKSYYRCVGPGQLFYLTCPAGTLYDGAACDYPANVACVVPADVSSPPPSPLTGPGSSPPPAPRPPSPSPPTTRPPPPRPKPPSPRPPSPRPPPPRQSPKPPPPRPKPPPPRPKPRPPSPRPKPPPPRPKPRPPSPRPRPPPPAGPGSAAIPYNITSLAYTSPVLLFANKQAGALPAGVAQCGPVYSYTRGFAFRWQAPAAGTVKATTCGLTDADTMLAVLRADTPTGPWQCIRSNDDDPGCAATNAYASASSFPSQAGKHYLFVVAEYENNAAPSFRLRVTGPATLVRRTRRAL